MTEEFPMKDNDITIYFDDTDDYFLELPESVTVFKIREPWNFDFENHKWRLDLQLKANTAESAAKPGRRIGGGESYCWVHER